MMSYYSAIITLSCMAVGILCILVWESERIASKDKRVFYITYGLIALSALAEWAGVYLDGREQMPKWALMIVKCADYTLTPLAGGALVAQMKLRSRWHRLLMGILAANALFQAISCLTGWMIVIDGQNHYTHGPLYGVYIAVYLVVILLVVMEFMAYGKTFRKQNRVSLYAVIIMLIAGIGIQEMISGGPRTAYLTMTLAAALLYIHYTEFAQIADADYIREQQIQITTDALTGLSSRYAYSKALKELDAAPQLPQDLAVFAIDINELKTVNDTQGHDAGDELICGAAKCIEKVFSSAGECCRTGGDEFVVLARMQDGQAAEALQRLEKETAQWSGKYVKALSLSAGYALACDHPGVKSEELVRIADQAMYAAKSAYYRKTGKDRRGQRREA